MDPKQIRIKKIEERIKVLQNQLGKIIKGDTIEDSKSVSGASTHLGEETSKTRDNDRKSMSHEIDVPISPEAYKEWVQEKIANKIFNRFLAIGAAGLVLLGTLSNYWIKLKFEHENKVIELKFEHEKGVIKDTVIEELQPVVDASVGKTLLDVEGVEKKIRNNVEKLTNSDEINKSIQGVINTYTEKSLPERIDELVGKALGKEETLEQLKNAAMDAIKKEGQIQQVLAMELKRSFEDSFDEDEKIQALQLLDAFRAGPELRDAQLSVLGDKFTQGKEIRRVALQTYRSAGDLEKDNDFFQKVIKALEQEEEITEGLGTAYSHFFKVQDDAFTPDMGEWIGEKRSKALNKIVIDGLIGKDNDEALKAIVKICKNDTPVVARLGWRGLRSWNPNSTTLTDMVRREALDYIWSEMVNRTELPEPLVIQSSHSPLERHVSRLYMAIREDNKPELERLIREGEAFDNDNLGMLYDFIRFDDLNTEILRADFRTEKDLLEFVMPYEDTDVKAQTGTSQPWSDRAVAFVNLVRYNDWERMFESSDQSYLSIDNRSDAQNIKKTSLILLLFRRLNKESKKELTEKFADKLIQKILDSPGLSKETAILDGISSVIYKASPVLVCRVLNRGADNLQKAENIDSVHKSGWKNIFSAAIEISTGQDFPEPYICATGFFKSFIGVKPSEEKPLKILQDLTIHLKSPSGKTLPGHSDLVKFCKKHITSSTENEMDYGLTLLYLILEPTLSEKNIIHALESENIFSVLKTRKASVKNANMLEQITKLQDKLHQVIPWIESLHKNRPNHIKQINRTLNTELTEGADTAWFSFDAERNKTYFLKASGTDAQIMLVSNNQYEVLFHDRIKNEKRFRLPDLEFGRYYLRVTAEESDNPNRKITIFDAHHLSGTEFPESAPLLQPGNLYIGEFSDRSHHWIRLSATAGTHYRMSTQPIDRDSIDTVVSIYQNHNAGYFDRDNDGGDDELGLDSQLEWLCRKTGIYFINIKNINESGRGNFCLNLMSEKRFEADALHVASNDSVSAPKISVKNQQLLEIQLPNHAGNGLIKFHVESDGYYRVSTTGQLSSPDSSGHLIRWFVDDSQETSPVTPYNWILKALDKVVTLMVTRPESEMPAAIFLRVSKEGGESINLSDNAIDSPISGDIGDGRTYRFLVKPGEWFVNLAGTKGDYHITTASLPAGLEFDVTLLALEGDQLKHIGSWGTKSDEQSVKWSCKQAGKFTLKFNISKGPGEILLFTTDTIIVNVADSSEPYNDLKEGDRVILGSHDDLSPGGRNWNKTMEQFVGREATIVELRDNKDESGSYTAHVDIDNQRWIWRTRNMKRQIDVRLIGEGVIGKSE